MSKITRWIIRIVLGIISFMIGVAITIVLMNGVLGGFVVLMLWCFIAIGLS